MIARFLREYIDQLDEITRPIDRVSVDEILNSSGYTRLGAGAYGAVYEKPGASYVLKVFTTKDIAYIDYIKLCMSNQSDYFPRFIGKMVRVNEVYSAIRMEKLGMFPMMKGDAIARNIREYIQLGDGVDGEVLDWLDEYPGMEDACDLIRTLDHPLDLKWDNVMKRGNIPVIVDPVKNAVPVESERLPYRKVERLPVKRNVDDKKLQSIMDDSLWDELMK